ncbi:MAG: DNA starvation/stationary phase protection protein Dps [Planctomycetia bacterium]|nr:DNA starvation/stationary phase protection protein Dps [Planctomycetia bacterium]
MPLHPTKNDLPEDIRTKAVALLNSRLADALDLESQTKQAHWNVKGPNFIALHELFDDIHEDVGTYVDDIAERAAQLGGRVLGTVRVAAGSSKLPEYPLDITCGKDHVAALSTALSVFGKLARQAIDDSAGFNDADTADLFTGVSRGIDKWLWMVESHLQNS